MAVLHSDHTYFYEAIDQLGFGVEAYKIIKACVKNAEDLLDENSILYIVNNIIDLIQGRGPIPPLIDLLTDLYHRKGRDQALWIPSRLFQRIFSTVRPEDEQQKFVCRNRLHILLETGITDQDTAVVSWLYGRKWHKDMEYFFYPPDQLELRAVRGTFSPSFEGYREHVRRVVSRKDHFDIRVTFANARRRKDLKALAQALTLDVTICAQSSEVALALNPNPHPKP
jgi:hypothetical protein